MAYKLFDLQCSNCKHECEELLEADSFKREEELRYYHCEKCEHYNTCHVVFTGCRVNTMSCLTKEDYSKKMAKRSVDHSNMLRKKGLSS